MEYVLLGLGSVLLVALGAWRLATRTKQIPAAAEDARPQAHLSPRAQLLKLQRSDNFWGVRVESHCRASSRLAGNQYPFDVVPVLPVEDCEAAQCSCVLVGLAERRARSDRRRGEDRRRSLRMDTDDRRSDRPRRRVDLNSWSAYSHL